MKSEYAKNCEGKRCRSPCGERGLKFACYDADGKELLSLPVRGAWVEIIAGTDGVYDITVAPRAGSVG